MTLLRFWRRPKDGESDEEFDKSEASQCNTDTSMEQKGKALQFFVSMRPIRFYMLRISQRNDMDVLGNAKVFLGHAKDFQ